MADTTVPTALQVEQWDSDFFAEYVRTSRFMRYMGTDSNSIIQINEELTKDPGDKITIPFVDALDGDGVTGNTTLEGAEEALGSSGHKIEVDMLRHAVAVTKFEEKKSPFGLRGAARAELQKWAKKKLRDAIIDAMTSPVTDGSTKYADASEAQKDAWLVANVDRVLFGAAKSQT